MPMGKALWSMKKRSLLLAWLCSLSVAAGAQGDIIVIRKKDRTIQTYFIGSVAKFVTTSGEAVTTRVHDIRNDSLMYYELMVRQVPTPWGVTRLDTVATILRGIHYSEIAAIPKPRKLTQATPENLLMVGGAGYLFVNLVNAVYLNYSPFSRQNLRHILPATGALAAGIVISKLRSNYYVIGKKFQVHYIAM